MGRGYTTALATHREMQLSAPANDEDEPKTLLYTLSSSKGKMTQEISPDKIDNNGIYYS